MKTIKVIDLLNKIANGEELPDKVIFNGEIYWQVETEHYGVYKYKKGAIHYLTDYADLNDEVEIIEEDNKKIEYIGKTYDLTDFYYKYKEAAGMLKDIGIKLKEIIDEVNKLKDETK